MPTGPHFCFNWQLCFPQGELPDVTATWYSLLTVHVQCDHEPSFSLDLEDLRSFLASFGCKGYLVACLPHFLGKAIRVLLKCCIGRGFVRTGSPLQCQHRLGPYDTPTSSASSTKVCCVEVHETFLDLFLPLPPFTPSSFFDSASSAHH